MLMTAFSKNSVRNIHYIHIGSTTPKAEREIPSLFAELPGRGVLGNCQASGAWSSRKLEVPEVLKRAAA